MGRKKNTDQRTHRERIFAKIVSILVEEFQCRAPAAISEQTHPNDFLKKDAEDWLLFTQEIEDEFDLVIDEHDLRAYPTLGGIVGYVFARVPAPVVEEEDAVPVQDAASEPVEESPTPSPARTKKTNGFGKRSFLFGSSDPVQGRMEGN